MDFSRFFGKDNSSSKSVAKERLKLVLVHDRTNCSPNFLEMVRGDIINVISDYIEIDEKGLDIRITKTKRSSDDAMVPALVANIPIKKVKSK
ncbi:MAG: cell division topological specificity factor MinE [Anaeromicrobium sp.]|jgi:cell division topological specificity factor|uniref:Cell division topological specificity factor n=1 Tax=Anaeromicrobium sediminis TaxID=1478221 RepID=A0A267MRL0_9FIRM|nr:MULTISPECIES: cell division topological specificity factor MinE [Anaeromicrobium]MCT4594951.1 cell division topological specificity factor MinE [Anaeromicrobium sp.]PAB61370.1 cell division topological specificity factor MinE [Anaeromicrobium sediminis]